MALEIFGMKLLVTVPVELQDTDLSSQCIKLKAANPDCVLMYLSPKHGAIMLGTAAKMGFKPQWMSSSVLSDTAIMFKISKGLFKDVIFATFAELADSRHPLMKKYRMAQERFAPNDRWGVFFYAGFGFVEVMVEGLKRCGSDLTADNFVRAMESLKDFQGIGAKITFGPDRRQGTRASFLARAVEGGKAVRFSDWINADIDLQEVIRRMNK